jgi:hypothetical protein
MSRTVLGQRKALLAGAAIAILLAAGFIVMAVRTAPVRQAVAKYTELLGAVNRQDVDAVRRLCSSRYLSSHPIVAAEEGGIVGMPRNIHKNFQAWRQGAHVWLCPTNRVGPVYQFVHERGAWRFDGPVGLLRGRNEFIPGDDLSQSEPPEFERPARSDRIR